VTVNSSRIVIDHSHPARHPNRFGKGNQTHNQTHQTTSYAGGTRRFSRR
jgi:hypothetical protein